MPRPHPPEFRRRAVELAKQRGPDCERLQPVAKTPGTWGISESCLRNWSAQDAIDTGTRPGLTSEERKELAELRRRNRVLEMEVEILKRASAYFARENILPNDVCRLRDQRKSRSAFGWCSSAVRLAVTS